MQLPDGLYDKLVTESVAQLIAGLRDPSCRTLSALPPEEASERIADALARQVTLLLDELDGNGAEKAKRQLALVNALLVHLRQQARRAAWTRWWSLLRYSGLFIASDLHRKFQRLVSLFLGCLLRAKVRHPS